MSPELVDQTILAECQSRFRKVALVIVRVARTLEAAIPMERLFVDVPETFEKPDGLEVDVIADRIKALVKAKRLEAARNLDRWRYVEIRLPEK